MTATPNATYRLQLTPEFGFAAVAHLAAYLRELGISHVYLSPHLQAAAGSRHGYDVIDHARVSEELGGAQAHADMLAAFAAHGLSVVIDVVPNHMSVARAADNAWWWDVLENGPSSRWADYFDVDWLHADERIRNKVLLPVLGDHYGRVLDAGKITVVRDGSRVVVRAYEQIYPVGPRSLGWILQPVAARLGNETLAFIADVLEELPSPMAAGSDSRARRHRDKAAIQALLAQLVADTPAVAVAIDERLAAISADVDRLDELLERQNYRLAYWRSARFDLDYRRFFDINELVGLRMNEAKVFADTHALPLSWVTQGAVTGLRVDHPDGLVDPETYLQRLRAQAPDAWIVVEKILEHDETLPASWPVQGTTGYDFCARLSGLWIDAGNSDRFDAIFSAFTGAETPRFAPMALAKKRYIVREVLGADVRRITEHFVAVCEHQRDYRDTTRDELRSVIEAVLVALPVYRTYVRVGGQASAADRAAIAVAVRCARELRSDIDERLFALIEQVLCGDIGGVLEGAAMSRFQQASGPITAKGVEDTAFYTYQRFIALNEVGGDPDRFGASAAELHTHNARIQREWPLTMVTTSTHDTKRSEDVRARLAVVSELPDAWGEAVRDWSRRSARYRDSKVDRDVEYHLYQTLVGAWPIGGERLASYLEKAMREAKMHTAWIRIDEAYERAVQSFAATLLEDRELTGSIARFVDGIARAGEENALAQKLLALTSPGVPDVYQGSELWDLCLADPDNRRPVDYGRRHELLFKSSKADVRQVLVDWSSGLPKLWLTQTTLATRARFAECFGEQASYTPLWPAQLRLFAFVRGSAASKRRVAILTTRLRMQPLALELTLPSGAWTNVFTLKQLSGTVSLASLLGDFPVALLTADAGA